MADIKIPKSTPCQFIEAWVGKCNKPSTNGWCTEHESLMCCVCGAKAVRNCDHTSSLICGAPLCGTCKHSLKEFEHVTAEVYMRQTEERRTEQRALEQSRTNPEQRLDKDGIPVNLFELLKKNPEDQGYNRKEVFFLELEHRLLGFFPAVTKEKDEMILCLDRELIIRIWKTLKPRRSKLVSMFCYVDQGGTIAFEKVSDPLKQERAKPMRIMNKSEYETLIANDPEAIEWAPGLIGGELMDKETFSLYVDKQAADSAQ